ncbi:hypothetical protein BGW36DRAFT_290785 [Talaromyces proteolyticus]|uniref:Uncharacterized protein n=1 Tax=Talaromyces proteolyticus TaxID=1131652 RepID=A0AAD4Q429_9EURO|nr:uncharacterized protein BGW36DRAFT_290785 [Talaromyces proteolyticus]KAH8702428.1 hypothetical protein BGW36DRAFT_290785 [Talaromyces proteolyticus]
MPSESGSRMRRSKSTPSVRKRRSTVSTPEALDPQIARHHATTAASLAMAQAKGRTAHASYEERKPYRGDIASMTVATTVPTASRTPRHSPSIRFVREGGNKNYTDTAVSPTLPSIEHETDGIFEQCLPDDDYAIREFQGFGNEELFAPSSYRRLRKARSMFSTRSMRSPRGGAVPSNEMSNIEPSLLKRNSEIAVDKPKSLRHSLSFFNGASSTIRRAKSHYAMSNRVQLSEESVKEAMPRKHPLLPSKENRLSQKSLRPTVRAMREMSPDDDAVPVSDSNGVHKKARAFSINIKKRLKRVFGIPGSSDDQLSEDRSFGSPYSESIAFDSLSTFDGASPPTLRSRQSLESIDTSASRVTSWTNSTAGNTVKTRHAPSRNHLSTIEEGVDAMSGQQFEMPEFRRSERVAYPQSKQIDSQRIYSALMKHIGESSSKNGETVLSAGAVRGYPTITERSSSVQPSREGRGIRPMASDMSMKNAQTSLQIDSRPESSQSHISGYSHYLDANRFIAKGKSVSRNPSKAPLKEPDSLFFPSTASHKPKTPSPYRMAMNSIRENDYSDDDATSVIIRQTTRCVSTSPSVYSRTPSGQAINHEDLCHEYETPGQSGIATIFDSQVPYRSPKKHGSSGMGIRSKNSAEWKNWMDTQMNNITVFDAPKLICQPVPRDHHREDAECDEEPILISPPTRDRLIEYNEMTQPRTSLSELRKLYTLRDLRPTASTTETKPLEQSNFSRPLSRQSVASLRTTGRSAVNSCAKDLCAVSENNNIPHQQDIRDPPGETFRTVRSKRLVDIANSSNRSLAIRTAREARINRSPDERCTMRQVDDQKGAKTVQFRSVREGPDDTLGNKENERSPSVNRKGKSVVRLSDLTGLHSTIDSKRMVDLFLDSRRGRENNAERDTPSPAFI